MIESVDIAAEQTAWLTSAEQKVPEDTYAIVQMKVLFVSLDTYKRIVSFKMASSQGKAMISS